MAKTKQENILNFLQCASILEKRAHALYRELADRVDLPLVNSLLLHIAYDSQKHSEIFNGISESIDKSWKKPKDCSKKLGGVWATIEGLTSEIVKEKMPVKETLPALVKKLTALESAMAEEYYIIVQVNTLKFMTKQIRELYDVNLEDLKEIFETIIRDEEIHKELLAKMKKILGASGKEEQAEDKAPEVKYNNPDAWTKAMPNSIYENAR